MIPLPFIRLSSVLITLTASGATAVPGQLYEVVTETGMPHLEESLRYSITREQRCLTERDLPTAFPILRHGSLADCSLKHETRAGDNVSYALVCEGDHGTTGTAVWTVQERLLRGTLNVKLGGKNMTFYQRVTARALGRCEAPST